MTNLKEMTVKELQVEAKGLGIALSYTKDGKRHKLNKPELIAAIEGKQVGRRRSIVGFLKDNYEENLNHAIEVLERLVKPSAHEIF